MVLTAFLKELAGNLQGGVATEHTYRPALKMLLDAMLAPAVAVNEPKRAMYGAPDFLVQQGSTPIGYVEAKDIGVDLARAVADSERERPATENGRQLKRYRSALPNLLYTDGLEWHWFVGGQARLESPVRIAAGSKSTKKLTAIATAEADLTDLLQQFGMQQSATVSTPRDLAQRLALMARWLRDVIVEVFRGQGEEGDLHQQLDAFRKTLLPTLGPAEFADMYAQTIVYGLFAARVALPDHSGFSRFDAATAIPKTNPFLRRLFQAVAGFDLDERISWLVDDCAHLLNQTDMSAVLRDFGRAARREDPVVHFYETFLAAYDPKLREVRGVYYTPEPIVSYIVRSVDALIHTHFNKPLGLADEEAIILDPATGTATFLHAVVQQIFQSLQDQGLAGIWPSYVSEKLLPRLFGFELLMAPYTVAHLKLGLLLTQLGATFGTNERLGIYLTNALADAPSLQTSMAFAQFITSEGQAAHVVKHERKVMVVLGNPPYSGHSANKNTWFGDLVRDYYQVDGQPLKERNSKWLQNDYVKFLRFGQWRIDETGAGILAYITDNSYLDSPTFRGMRQHLMGTFSHIYILDLHGNSRKRERTPDGGPDENVFDIQQGVTIAIFVKEPGKTGPASIYHRHLWGLRAVYEETPSGRQLVGGKYHWLQENDIETTSWVELMPRSPSYLFVPEPNGRRPEYERAMSIAEMMPLHSMGINTHRDRFVIDLDRNRLLDRIASFSNASPNDLEKGGHGFPLDRALKVQSVIKSSKNRSEQVIDSLYRPFDIRSLYWSDMLIDRPRLDTNRHMMRDNISLVTTRQTREPFAALATHLICSQHKITAAYDGSLFFPLYLYTDTGGPYLRDDAIESATKAIRHSGRSDAFTESARVAELIRQLFPNDTYGRWPNLSPVFLADLTERLGLSFSPDGKGDLTRTVGPEDAFHYIYAILHSPTYRGRYSELLKVDFPRVPLTSNQELFAALVIKGAELVDLHLLRLPGSGGVGGAGGAGYLARPGQQGVSFPRGGSGIVERVEYVPPEGTRAGRVRINLDQYIEGVEPETWGMHIGGHQPLERWLKDRKGYRLSSNDIQHYLRVVIALRETRRIMTEIDMLISNWPL